MMWHYVWWCDTMYDDVTYSWGQRPVCSPQRERGGDGGYTCPKLPAWASLASAIPALQTRAVAAPVPPPRGKRRWPLALALSSPEREHINKRRRRWHVTSHWPSRYHHLCMHMYVGMYECICICVYVYVYVSICIIYICNMYLYNITYIYIYIYMYMYIYIYEYIHI